MKRLSSPQRGRHQIIAAVIVSAVVVSLALAAVIVPSLDAFLGVQ